jgi:hypothetical protein
MIRHSSFVCRHSSFWCSTLLLLLFVLLQSSSAATLSDPQVDSYNMRVGTETFAGMYKFTTNTLLVETAQAITNMGSDVIKMYMGSSTANQSGVTLPSNVTNLLTLARDEPSYHQVLDMTFRHFVIWAYALANSDQWWGSGYNSTQGAKDYNEMYALTQYLLTNYNNSGKTFYLGHWEGDGYLSVNNWSTNPNPATIQGMIGWLNNRQKAVDDAKRATAYTNVNVFNYTEANRVRDAMLNGPNNNQRVINMVLPYVTNIDYLSYSSYDAQNLSTADLYTTLNYMQSMLPTNKASVVPGERMWIGEYGWGGNSTTAQEPLNRAYIQRLLGWNSGGQCLKFILFWEMYSNYNPNGGTNFCLIDYLGNKVPSWYLQHYFFNQGRLLTARFKETNGRLPADTEFSSMVSPQLNAPLPAPVNLTIANAGSTVSSNSVSVSGTLTQGVYGDDCARVWVYYGSRDGGTMRSAWDKSQLIGTNTLFNPASFTTTLSSLVPQTNYYFRFYATNASGEVWAPVAGQFSTQTLNPPDYGCRIKLTFSGYNRGETLSNFPVLVNLSTSLPGFSYRQFASPTGGDLRFTDAGGYVLLPYEIDEWNTNGSSRVWVRVPQLATPNDFIWAYWGNPAAAAPPAWTTNGSVWSSDHYLVWHLKEKGFPYADSTQQFPGLPGVAPASATGLVGSGCTFDGASQYINAQAINVGNTFTLSALVKLDNAATNIQTVWANKPGGWNSAGFDLYVDSYNTADKELRLETGDGTAGQTAYTAAGAVSFGQWHHLAAVVDRAGGTAHLYVDGVDRTQSGGVATDFPTQSGINLGRTTNNSFYLKGTMDEARIEATTRSASWIWASWMTMASNSTLAAYSTVTQQSPALSFGASTNSLLLGWPGSAVGFSLYTATNLTPPVSWMPATNQPVWGGNQWQVTLPANSPNRFYRLQSP